MGAWGVGIFEDDGALDTLGDIAQVRDLRAALETRLRRAIAATADELDPYDALVPAAIIDAYIHGTIGEDLAPVRARHPRAELRALGPLAAQAVERVLDPEIELHELWAENEEDYPAWTSNLEALRTRLSR